MKKSKMNLLAASLCVVALVACDKSTHVHSSTKKPYLLESEASLHKSEVKEKRMVKKYH